MSSAPLRSEKQKRGGYGVAFAFFCVLGFTTVPTPLWSLYAARDGYSSLTVTLLFAVYAVGVAASLFFFGHLSDVYGRRSVLAAGLSLNLLAAAVFVFASTVIGLLVARLVSGAGIGVVAATATAWLVELHILRSGEAGRRRAETIAAAVNLSGLGAGALVAGIIAQWSAHPLTLPYVAYLVLIATALIIVLFYVPETRPPLRPRPPYAPQRVSVPEQARGRYFAAATAAAIAFAQFGFMTSLTPHFLAGSLGHRSLALAGLVTFAGFAAAAVAQAITADASQRSLLWSAVIALLLGPSLLTLAVWLPDPSIWVFLFGVLVTGAGCGLMFKGALASASELAPPETRAEVLAGMFLAAYLGLAGPVIGLGLLLEFMSARASLIVFNALLTSGVLLAARALLGASRRTEAKVASAK